MHDSWEYNKPNQRISSTVYCLTKDHHLDFWKIILILNKDLLYFKNRLYVGIPLSAFHHR